MMHITLNAILRAIFGAGGSELDSANTEPEPNIRLRLGWMLPSSSGLLVKTCLASCGSATTTTRPYIRILAVKALP